MWMTVQSSVLDLEVLKAAFEHILNHVVAMVDIEIGTSRDRRRWR
jgi:hypothetical protein